MNLRKKSNEQFLFEDVEIEVEKLCFSHFIDDLEREEKVSAFINSTTGKSLIDIIGSWKSFNLKRTSHANIQELVSSNPVREEKSIRIRKIMDMLTLECSFVNNYYLQMFYRKVLVCVLFHFFNKLRVQDGQSGDAIIWITASLDFLLKECIKFKCEGLNLSEVELERSPSFYEHIFLPDKEAIAFLKLCIFHYKCANSIGFSTSEVRKRYFVDNENVIKSLSVLCHSLPSSQTKELPYFIACNIKHILDDYKRRGIIEESILLFTFTIRMLGGPRKRKQTNLIQEDVIYSSHFFDSLLREFYSFSIYLSEIFYAFKRFNTAKFILKNEIRWKTDSHPNHHNCEIRQSTTTTDNNKIQCTLCGKCYLNLSRICIETKDWKQGIEYARKSKSMFGYPKCYHSDFDFMRSIEAVISELILLWKMNELERYRRLLENTIDVARKRMKLGKNIEDVPRMYLSVIIPKFVTAFQSSSLALKKNKKFSPNNTFSKDSRKTNTDFKNGRVEKYFKTFKKYISVDQQQQQQKQNKRNDNNNIEEFFDDCSNKIKKILKNRRKGTKCEECWRFDVHLSRCSGCKEVYYCSRKCQKRSWKEHKKRCGRS